MKRKKYLTWDEFFMGVAELASKRSKDPSTQNGACIVDPETNRILSVGYNGLPKGLSDEGYYKNNYDFPDFESTPGDVYNYWEKPQKYDYAVHAEENAFFNATEDLKGSIIYIYSERGYPPCSRCARGILQNGIREVVLKTMIKENTETYNWDATLHMFKQANINLHIMEK